MKNNAETAAAYVQKAISETGGDFALSNARQYLMAALSELNTAHKKREKRESNFKKLEQQEKEKLFKLKLEEAKKRLKILDDMLEIEQTKQQNGSNWF